MSENQGYTTAALAAAFTSGKHALPLTHTRALQVIASLEGVPDWFALRHRSDLTTLKARAKFLRAELNCLQGDLTEEHAATIIGRLLAVKADQSRGRTDLAVRAPRSLKPLVRWETQDGQVISINPLAAEISFVAGESGSGKSFSVSRVIRACSQKNIPVTIIEYGHPSYEWCPCIHTTIRDTPAPLFRDQAATMFDAIIAAARRNPPGHSVIVFDECYIFTQPDLLGPTAKFITEGIELSIHPIMVTQSLFDLEPLKPLLADHKAWRTHVYQFKSKDFLASNKLNRNGQYSEFLFVADGKETETLVMRPSPEEHAMFTTRSIDIEQIKAIQASRQCTMTEARKEFARKLDESRREQSVVA